MKHRKKQVICALLSAALLAGIGGVSAKKAMAAEADTLAAVDKTKGVTYIYDEKGKFVGINLNGNSVIMDNAEKDGSEAKFFKIYLDANGNGTVDAGEKAVEFPDDITTETKGDKTEYLPIGVTVYGVYQQKTTDAFVITNKAEGGQLIGVYKGEAADVTIHNSGAFACIYGAEKSTVNGTITVENNEATKLATCFNAYDSTVNGNLVLKNTDTPVSSYLMAGNTCTITGDVNVTVDGTSTDTDYAVSKLWALLNCQTKGKFNYIHQGGYVAEFYGVKQGSVTSTDTTAAGVSITYKGTAKVNASYAVSAASVNSQKSKYAVDIQVTGTPVISSAFYGVYAESEAEATIRGNLNMNISFEEMPDSWSFSMISMAYTWNGMIDVFGDVTGNFTNVRAGSIYGVYGKKTTIGGKYDYTLAGCYISGSNYANYEGIIQGNLTVNSDKNTYSNYYYFSYGGLVTGNVTAKIYGLDKTVYPSAYCYCYGVYGYNKMSEDNTENNSTAVDGDVDIRLLGGDFDCVQALSEAPITGDLTVTMTGISHTSGYGANMISRSNIKGDVTVTTDENCYFKQSLGYVLYGNYSGETQAVGGNVKIDIQNAYKEEAGTYNSSYLYGLCYYTVKGNVDINIHGGSWGYVYGVYNSNSCIIEGDCKVKIEDVAFSSTSNSYALYGGSGAIAGNIDVSLKNITGNNYYLYGVYYVNALTEGKKFNVTCDNVKGASSLYGVYNSSCGIYSDVTFAANDVETNYSFYAIEYANLMGQATVDVTDVSAGYFYGLENVQSTKKIDLNITECSSNPNANYKGTYFINYNTQAAGGLNVKVKDCNFDCVNALYMNLTGDVDFEIDGGTYAYYGNVINAYSVTGDDGGHKVTTTMKNATITTAQNAETWYINNYVSGNNTSEITIESTCTIPEKYVVSGNTQTESAACVSINNEIYYSGHYPFTAKDVKNMAKVGLSNYAANLPSFTVKQIEFYNSEVLIPEDVTVKATEGFIIRGGSIVLAGTLDGPCLKDGYNNEINTDYHTRFFMNGGTISNAALDQDAELDKWYLVTIEYDDTAMTVTNTNLITPTLLPKTLFARTGTAPSLVCVAKKGYTMEGCSATFTPEGGSPTNLASTVANGKTTYKFDMVSKPATVVIECGGIPLQLGKTVADPVAKLNQTYTEAAPLYDFTKSLVVYNDSDEDTRTMTYALSAGETMPEGLTLSAAGLITGKPTKAYEDGKKVKFAVTGKNKSKAEISLNIIVTTKDDKEQTDQEGRLLIDTTAKTINCLGTSVVIKSATLADETAGTAIYLDENSDGVADRETPVVTGDYAAYTLIGVSGITVTKPIRITMEGGKFTNLYGAQNATVTTENADDAIYLDMRDGSVTGIIYGAYNSTVAEGVKVETAKSGLSRTLAATSGGTCKYAYLRNVSAVSVSGDYILKKDLEVATFVINYGTSLAKPNTVTIESGKTLKTTTSLQLSNYTRMYNMGTVDTPNYYAGAYSYHLLIGNGTVKQTADEGNNYQYLYYPVTVTCDESSIPVVAKATAGEIKAPYMAENTYLIKYDGILYAPNKNSNLSVPLTYYTVPGYRAYYSMNGKDDVLMDKTMATGQAYQTSASIQCENKATTLHVTYVPEQIEANVKFGAPTVMKETEYDVDNPKYDADSPVYDFGTVKLENDTTANYGTAPVYQLKSGSALPAGLSLDKKTGKVTGTPTAITPEEGTPVTVLITGRNGTRTEVTVTITVTNKPIEKSEINKLITWENSNLDLNGTSVVIHPDEDVSSYCNIYLDENHDGVADNDEPFVDSKGNKAINLSYTRIYGYRNTEEPLDKKLTIYAYGGTASYLYGLYGTSMDAPAVSTDTVSVYMKGMTVSNGTWAGYYASANELNLSCTAGTLRYYVGAAYYPVDVKKVNFEFTDKAYYYGSSSTAYSLCATQGGKISGDVHVKVGGSGDTYGFSSTSSRFRAVNGTKVTGDVNCAIVGNWRPGYENNFAYNATIDGTLNVDWQKGYMTTYYSGNNYRSIANLSTIDKVNIEVGTGVNTNSSSYVYPYYGGTIQTVYMNIPKETTGIIYTSLQNPNDTTTLPVKSGYVYNKGVLYLSGKTDIEESLDLTSMTIHAGSDISVVEDATINLVNSLYITGRLTNRGTMTIGSTLTVAEDSELVNEGTMTCSNSTALYGKLTNKGKLTHANIIYTYNEKVAIVNSGDWTTNGEVRVTAAGVSIVNNKTWTANAVTLNAENLTLTNNGDWTTNAGVNVYKATDKITNNGNWNMNYLLNLSYGELVHSEGATYKTANGKYSNGNTRNSYTQLQNTAKLVNKGTWTGNAYLSMSGNTVLDNEGSMNITNTEYSYDYYLYGNTMLINREDAVCNINGRVYSYANAKIVNLGTMKQTYKDGGSYHYQLGIVYAAKPLTLSDADNKDYYMNYTSFFYPITVSYPDKALTGVSLPGAVSSGADGDTRLYVKGGQSFTVAVDGYKGSFKQDDVTVIYGQSEQEAVRDTLENQWKGTMPQESLIVQVNVAKNNQDPITLDPASATVEQLTVNTNNSKIYDLRNIKISKDDDELEGEVTYAVSATKPLPEGLTLNENGIISGTPKYASDESYTAEIIVTGKNLTTAKFELNFAKINKATPVFNVPTGIYGYTHNKLADVRGIPTSTTGTYSWPDDQVDITENCVNDTKFTLYFTPKDTDNYDWSKINKLSGTWDADNKRVECQVSITMYAIAPTYTNPSPNTADNTKPIQAVYGQTLADVKLPQEVLIEEGEYGDWVWRQPTTSVGAVGAHTFYADFVPRNQKKFYTATYIVIKINVVAKEVEITIPTGLRTITDYTLGQVELPKSEHGEYKWLTASTTVVQKNTKYKLVFVPKNDPNIKWMPADGMSYSQAYGGYVMDVTVEVLAHEQDNHTFETKYDDTYHWEECLCGEIRNKAKHEMTAKKTDAVKHTYECSNEACKHKLEEKHEYKKNMGDDKEHWHQCVCGDKISVETHYYYIWKYEEDKHWKECSCGKATEKVSHVYSETWKYDSVNHWLQCDCGSKMKTDKHDFKTLQSNDYYHWYKCNTCDAINGYTAHKYGDWHEKADDITKHVRECSCGHEEAAAHAYGTCTSVDDKTHQIICEDCGKTVVGNHVMDTEHPIITLPPTETTDGSKEIHCKDCDYYITEVIKATQGATHTYDENYYEFNETEHWIVCDDLKNPDSTKVCHNEKPDSRVKHTFSDWKVDAAEDVHYKECACGYRIQSGKHTWKVYTEDETNHWEYCTVCGTKANIKAHQYTAQADEVHHWKECACGSRIDVGQHAYTDTGSDDQYHWDACSCSFCTKIINKTAHDYSLWTEDKVNCTADKHVHIRSCGCGKTQSESFEDDAKVDAFTKYKQSSYSWTEITEDSVHTDHHRGVCKQCGGGEVIEEHTWDGGRVEKEPTTTEEGSLIRKCTKCPAEKTEVLAKLPKEDPDDHKHAFTEWDWNQIYHWKYCETEDMIDPKTEGVHEWGTAVVTKEATEQETGLATYRCIYCEYEVQEVIPLVIHKHKFSEEYMFDSDYHWKFCRCGEVEDEGKHEWDKGKVTVAATEDNIGIRTYSCMTCDATWQEIIPKLGKEHSGEHIYGEWTGADDESHIHYCDCGVYEYGDHAYGNWEPANAKMHKCVCYECDYEYYEAHEWNDGVLIEGYEIEEQDPENPNEIHIVTVPPVIRYTCYGCGDTKEELYDGETHMHKFKYCQIEDNAIYHYKVCQDPECGYAVYDLEHRYPEGYLPYDAEEHVAVCKDCGFEIYAAHRWDAGVYTEPTEEEEGKMVYTCTVCYYAETEIIPKLEHKHHYEEWIPNDADTHKRVCACGDIDTQMHDWDAGFVTKEPTDRTEGVRTYTCSVCGYEEDETIPKLELEPDDPDDPDEPDDPEEGVMQPGEEFEDGDASFMVIDPKEIDPEDEETTPAVVYAGAVDETAEDIIVPDTITVDGVDYRVVSIADEAFKDNKKLKKIIIGNNIKTIGESAFENCSALKTVSFKKTSKVKIIGKKAFYKCTALTKVTLPKSVEEIKDSAFQNCKKLTTVTFQSGSKLKKIGAKVFYGCIALTKITIPKNVTAIGGSAFYNCKKLKTATFQSGSKLKTLGNKVFYGCIALTKITLPTKVTSIGTSAFQGCKKLATITIKSTKLNKVGKNAFKGIKSNAKIKVPAKKLKAYKKLLKSKGQGKKVIIKKI